jgi:ubiquitin-activating enzyme E1
MHACVMVSACLLVSSYLVSFLCLSVSVSLSVSPSYPLPDLCRFNEHCRSRSVKEIDPMTSRVRKVTRSVTFIYGAVTGFVGSVFSDMGEHHIVEDDVSVNEERFRIKSISIGDGVVQLELPTGKTSHGFQTDDIVNFSDVTGLEALNELTAVPITVPIDSYGQEMNDCIKLEGTSFYDYALRGTYKGGGFVTRAIAPFKTVFQSLESQIAEPAFDRSVMTLGDSRAIVQQELHACRTALLQFEDKYGRLPVAGDETDVKNMMPMVERAVEKMKEAHALALGADTESTDQKHSSSQQEDTSLPVPLSTFPCVKHVAPDKIKRICVQSRTQPLPVCMYVGAIVAQEVCKVVGKMHPIQQWYHIDAFSSVSECVDPSGIIPCNTTPCRYQHQIALFGSPLQSAIEDLQVLIAGTNVTGNELLRGAAMMGIACGNQGKLHVADASYIDDQSAEDVFAFTRGALDRTKSYVGSVIARTLNPQMNMNVIAQYLLPDNASTFSDAMLSSLSCVLIAHDQTDCERKAIATRGSRLHLPVFDLEWAMQCLDPSTRITLGHKYPTTCSMLASVMLMRLFNAAFHALSSAIGDRDENRDPDPAPVPLDSISMHGTESFVGSEYSYQSFELESSSDLDETE